MNSLIDINALVGSAGLSTGLWTLISAISFALLAICFCISVKSGNVKAGKSFSKACLTLLWTVALYAVGFSASFYWEPQYPLIVVIAAFIVCWLIAILMFAKRRKRIAGRVAETTIRKSASASAIAKYCKATLFGTSMVLAALSLASLLLSGMIDSQHFSFFLFPLIVVILTVILAKFTKMRFWYALGAVIIAAFCLLDLQGFLSVCGFKGAAQILASVPLCTGVILPLFSLSSIKVK